MKLTNKALETSTPDKIAAPVIDVSSLSSNKIDWRRLDLTNHKDLLSQL